MKNVLGKILSIFNLRQDLTLKLVSLLLAVLFWAFVMDKENPVITRTFYNLPVTYTGELKNDLVIASAPKYYSNVEITGRRNSVLATRSDSIGLYVNLSALKDGTNNPLVEYSTKLNDITITKIYPENVRVDLEQVISAPKSVVYTFSTPFQEAYADSTIFISPSELIVNGPRSLVAGVTALHTQLNAAEITESKDFQLVVEPVNSLGERVEGVWLSSNTVTATVRSIKERTVPVSYRYVDETGDNYELSRFTLGANYVVIKGEPEVVDGIAKIEAIPVVITDPKNARGTLQIEPIQGVSIQGIEQLTYSAEFIEFVERELEFGFSDLAFENLGEDLAVEAVDVRIVIRVRGAKSELEKIGKDNFQLRVDLAGLEEGAHDVDATVTAELPSKVTHEVVSGIPLNIQIEMRRQSEE